MNDLADYFRESSRRRLEEMRDALHALPDPAALEKLGRHFHAFAGMGGTYGFARVSELGDEAEHLMIALRRSGGAPDGETVARWRELVAEIARELC